MRDIREASLVARPVRKERAVLARLRRNVEAVVAAPRPAPLWQPSTTAILSVARSTLARIHLRSSCSQEAEDPSIGADPALARILARSGDATVSASDRLRSCYSTAALGAREWLRWQAGPRHGFAEDISRHVRELGWRPYRWQPRSLQASQADRRREAISVGRWASTPRISRLKRSGRHARADSNLCRRQSCTSREKTKAHQTAS